MERINFMDEFEVESLQKWLNTSCVSARSACSARYVILKVCTFCIIA